MRRQLAFLFAIIPALAFCQSKVHLEFESAGVRTGWTAPKIAQPPENAKKWDGKSADLEVSGNGATLVQILDGATGNLAVKPIKDAAGGWLVKDSDFRLVGQVVIRVEHEGAALSAANVQLLGNSAGGVTKLIDPSSKGRAVFYGVPPGTLKVQVDYNTSKGSKTQAQGFDLALRRDDPIPTFVVSLPDAVATVESKTSAPNPSNSTPVETVAPSNSRVAPREAHGGIGEIFLYLLAVCFAGLILYFGFVWLGKNGQKSQTILQKVGLSLQEPLPLDNTALNAASVPIPVPPAPPQKIMLSGADPTPVAGFVPASGTSSHLDPHLVGPNGPIPLKEGASVVGRDPGLEISLVGEASMSRRHAELMRSGSIVVVKDLGSTNGTFVNGIKLTGEATLNIDDTVQFGAVRFRYEG